MQLGQINNRDQVAIVTTDLVDRKSRVWRVNLAR